MSQPALKTSVPYFIQNNSIHFRLAGQLTSLNDPDGSVLALLKLLDGQHSPEEIHRLLSANYPALTFAAVQDAIRDLDEAALLQDLGDTGRDFGNTDRERWSNNLGFFETYSSLNTSKYEFQRRIRDAKVAVLGVGGIGSHVLIDLVAIGFQDIRIVDFDTIEVSNLNRQILYGEPFIGESKVKIAKERAESLNSSVRIDPIQLKISSADDVYSVAYDRDVVIAVVDRPKVHVKDWLNEGCVRAGVPLINAGVDTQRAIHYTVVPGISGCVQCWIRSVRTSDATSRMVFEELDRIDQGGHTYGEDTAAFNALVLFDAAYLVAELVRLTTRVSPPLSVGRQLEMTFHDPRLRVTETWQRDPECPACRHVEAKPSWQWLIESQETRPF
jgi:molybdopterin/thiamine biosynthesis adenylyltransferase